MAQAEKGIRGVTRAQLKADEAARIRRRTEAVCREVEKRIVGTLLGAEAANLWLRKEFPKRPTYPSKELDRMRTSGLVHIDKCAMYADEMRRQCEATR